MLSPCVTACVFLFRLGCTCHSGAQRSVRSEGKRDLGYGLRGTRLGFVFCDTNTHAEESNWQTGAVSSP